MNSTTRPNRPRVQLWILRLLMALMLTGLPGVLLPARAFEKFSWLMGYGQPPLTPLTIYLSGNAGYAYVSLAALFWAISRDLLRYQPLVRVCGWIMVVAGPAYLSMDLQCPLPLWWVLMDSLSCLLIGLLLLWACPPNRFATVADHQEPEGA